MHFQIQSWGVTPPPLSQKLCRVQKTLVHLSLFSYPPSCSDGSSAPHQQHRPIIHASCGAAFSLLFRGTSVRFYGISSKGGVLVLELDGKSSTVILNSTINGPPNGSIPAFSADKLEDGDHQLYGEVESRKENGVIIVDHFEIENSSGGGFALLWAGPNATNVPKEAVIVDDASPEIIPNNASLWDHDSANPGCYKQSLSYTNTTGASISYSFNGVAIWYYGSLGFSSSSASFAISIDGSTQRLNGKVADREVDQLMLWSNTSLGPGRHTLTLAHDDTRDTVLSLDFFRILRDEDTPALLSTPSTPTFTTTTVSRDNGSSLPTEAQAVVSTNKSSTVPLVVGLTLGLLAFIVLVFGGIFYRRRTQADFDGRSAALRAVPLTIQAHQQLSWVGSSKQHIQSSGMSGVTMASGDPTMSSGVTELGPPPSYDSRVHDGGIDTTY